MEEMMVSRTAIRIKIATNVSWRAWEVVNGYLRRLFQYYTLLFCPMHVKFGCRESVSSIEVLCLDFIGI